MWLKYEEGLLNTEYIKRLQVLESSNEFRIEATAMDGVMYSVRNVDSFDVGIKFLEELARALDACANTRLSFSELQGVIKEMEGEKNG